MLGFQKEKLRAFERFLHPRAQKALGARIGSKSENLRVLSPTQPVSLSLGRVTRYASLVSPSPLREMPFRRLKSIFILQRRRRADINGIGMFKLCGCDVLYGIWDTVRSQFAVPVPVISDKRLSR